uniref:Uncharacterized protein n=1 Tax=Anguilla anguilla TaxID=7936 RepID=A0A0E9WTK8_ANGAN
MGSLFLSWFFFLLFVFFRKNEVYFYKLYFSLMRSQL